MPHWRPRKCPLAPMVIRTSAPKKQTRRSINKRHSQQRRAPPVQELRSHLGLSARIRVWVSAAAIQYRSSGGVVSRCDKYDADKTYNRFPHRVQQEGERQTSGEETNTGQSKRKNRGGCGERMRVDSNSRIQYLCRVREKAARREGRHGGGGVCRERGMRGIGT